MVEGFFNHYNYERLHSAIGYITPADMLAGRAVQIWAERDRNLEEARARHRAADLTPIASVPSIDAP